ncbi:MAG: putative NAD/FAD-binding protein [Candidatus Azotimanducaceae bacterium]|jgi:predicted NAD/FAD-binding protein
MQRQKIAIIGSGISGLTSAWFLRHDHDVTLYEADSRLGGHTNTVDIEYLGRKYAVDTGFIVCNDHTYPNFLRLMAELGVKTQPAPMGFSVIVDSCNLEYSSRVPGGLLAQPSNMLKPSFIGMVRDILRFMREAPKDALKDASPSLGEYLTRNRYGKAFTEHYLLPIGSAIWSSPIDTLNEFPLKQFVHFFNNHGLLDLKQRVKWRTVVGGSQRYIDRLSDQLAPLIRLSTPVLNVRRINGKVQLDTADGEESFDQVAFACHSDQALRLISDPSPAEQEVLGAIPFGINQATLHTDASVLPKRRAAWSSWNYHVGAGGQPAALSYHMNALQGLDAPVEFCVSLNQNDRIDPHAILYKTDYSHPVYTLDSVAARHRWSEISGVDRLHFCGAYWEHGFHEDGVRSGLRVASSIDGRKHLSGYLLPEDQHLSMITDSTR